MFTTLLHYLGKFEIRNVKCNTSFPLQLLINCISANEHINQSARSKRPLPAAMHRDPDHRHTQCRINVGAIDAAALGPFKKQDHGQGRRNEKSLLYFGCDFSGWYNFGKINKTVATRCHILKLKCTKFDYGWGSAQDPAWGAYSAPADPLAGFKGAYF